MKFLLISINIDDWCQRFLVLIQVRHKVLNPIFIVEFFTNFFFATQVSQCHSDILKKKGWFFETLWDGVKFKVSRWKDACIRHEGNFCTCLRFRRFTHLFKPCYRVTTIFKTLAIDTTVTGNFYLKPTRQRINNWRTHTVKTSRSLITTLSKFTTSVENSENNFNCWFTHGMHTCRHPTSRVRNRNGTILI